MNYLVLVDLLTDEINTNTIMSMFIATEIFTIELRKTTDITT